MALAGGLMASSLNSAAQATAPAPVGVSPANRGNLTVSNNTAVPVKPVTVTAGDQSLLTRPLPAGANTTAVPVNASVISSGPGPGGAPTITPGGEGVVVTPGPGSIPPAPPKITDGVPLPLPARPAGSVSVDARPLPSGELRPGNVVFVGAPGIVTTSAGTNVPAVAVTPLATNSGVVVSAGDIPRVGSNAGTNNFTTVTQNGVLSVLQAFDAQRTTELQARNTALEQLRNATPEQRAGIIADLQAAQVQVAAEQREIARELRTEMRAMREERKGK